MCAMTYKSTTCTCIIRLENILLDTPMQGMDSKLCGVEGKRRLCDLNVTSSSPALATRHIRIVLLVNSPNKLNLLSWLLIYLCNK